MHVEDVRGRQPDVVAHRDGVIRGHRHEVQVRGRLGPAGHGLAVLARPEAAYRRGIGPVGNGIREGGDRELSLAAAHEVDAVGEAWEGVGEDTERPGSTENHRDIGPEALDLTPDEKARREGVRETGEAENVGIVGEEASAGLVEPVSITGLEGTDPVLVLQVDDDGGMTVRHQW
ncbi:hypothetical protein JIX56_06495 [Streptomyces sp. CA-210063]|nr:hypothetical protein [Streptomyces sp. CA-210063]UUU29559.1 hypothetical protein JIX56_06495 [Streptomyces sp. CA-210063]